MQFIQALQWEKQAFKIHIIYVISLPPSLGEGGSTAGTPLKALSDTPEHGHEDGGVP